MDWHVRYREDATERLERFPSPERAIEEAFHLLDLGHDVFDIGTGSLDDTIPKDTISRIYEIWVKSEWPFGKHCR